MILLLDESVSFLEELHPVLLIAGPRSSSTRRLCGKDGSARLASNSRAEQCTFSETQRPLLHLFSAVRRKASAAAFVSYAFRAFFGSPPTVMRSISQMTYSGDLVILHSKLCCHLWCATLLLLNGRLRLTADLTNDHSFASVRIKLITLLFVNIFECLMCITSHL